VGSVHHYLRHSTESILVISLVLLSFVVVILSVIWYYNRKRFHQLSHQIPANVMKSYLDSIIANSNALKSSLFRGGGLDIGEGIPSVVPTSDLPTGNVSGASSEDLAQKNAEIAGLKAMISEKERIIIDLERQLAAAREGSGGGASDEEVNALKTEVEDLKAQLAEAQAGGDDSGGGEKLNAMTKERDELKERLMEYEIIEEDLANLKRFQQENEQLKKTIEELKAGGAVAEEAPAAAPEAAPEPEAPAPFEEPAPEPAAEVTAAENPNADDDATADAAAEMPDIPANEGEQKSAEELLSEFEKMLG
jgi:hypothetical protein